MKQFQKSEMYEREKKKQSYRKEPKEKDSSIPGFISEELTLKILSEVFKVLKIVVYILLKFYVTFPPHKMVLYISNFFYIE